jgi:diguanylate cyclase (GGDEF)-like protein
LGLLVATYVALALGFADPARAPLPVVRVLALLVVPSAILALSIPRFHHRPGRLPQPLLAPAALALGGVLVQAGGGPTGALTLAAPIAALASSTAVGSLPACAWSIVLAAALGVAGLSGTATDPGWESLGLWLTGLGIAAWLPGRVLSHERGAIDRLRERVRELEDEAGGLRRESSEALPAVRTQGYDEDSRERDLRQVARQLQDDIDRACAVLVSTTGARTAVVYRPDGADDERLVAAAISGDTRGIRREVGAREGIVGAAFKAGTPVTLRQPRPGDPRLVHRGLTDGVGVVLALPMTEGDRRLGVVVLDVREITDELRAREVGSVIADFVARLVTRAVDLSAVREGMRENHAFYEACREVSRHVRIDDVCRAVVDASAGIADPDACAISLLDESGSELVVHAASGWHRDPTGTRIPVSPSEGLLVQSLRHKTPIHRTDLGGSELPPVIFGRDHASEAGLHALLVLPIRPPGGEDASPLGALVVARRGPPDMDDECRARLQVVLAQAGAAISNARLFAEHEKRSVTDGMTGLPNHRRFQEVLTGKLARAQRVGGKVSLLLLDIDKFKGINDTWGHPMGDEVIRRLAGVLESAVRDGTDLAARYGGEEFCVVLEDTDARGALILAERLREAFGREVFVHSDGGRPQSFRSTVSIGIATWPDDATQQADLIERSDAALYASKQGGRNRCTLVRDMRVGASA